MAPFSRRCQEWQCGGSEDWHNPAARWSAHKTFALPTVWATKMASHGLVINFLTLRASFSLFTACFPFPHCSFSFASVILYSFVVTVHEGALTLVRSQWSKNKTLHCNLHLQSPRSLAIEVNITGTRECHAQLPLTVSYGHFPDVILLSWIHPWTRSWLYSWYW